MRSNENSGPRDRASVLPLLTTLLVCVAAATQPAAGHGGRYYGPSLPPGPGPASPPYIPGGATSGPTTAPGVNPLTPPNVPGSIAPPGPSTASWENWWEFNWEWILDPRSRGTLAPDDGPTNVQGPRIPPRELVRERIWGPLLEAARHSNVEVRSAAMVALGKTTLPEAHEPITSALEDRERDVREAALIGLALLRHPASVSALSACLEDDGKPARERAFAAAGLGLLGTKEAVETLLKIADPTLNRRRKIPRQVRIATLLGLAAAGNATPVPKLLGWVEKGAFRDVNVRGVAVAALGRLGERAVVSGLQRALTDKTGQVREAAALALGGVVRPNDTEALRALMRASLEDKQPSVRAFCMISLGRIGGAETREFLRKVIGHKKSKLGELVLPYAYFGLGFCGEPAVDGPLLAYHFDKRRSTSTRGAAALALGKLGHRPAARTLANELNKTKNRTLHHYISISLAMLGETKVAPRLLEIVRSDRSPERVRSAIIALSLLDQANLIEIVEKRMSRERASVLRGAMGQAIAAVADARHLNALLAILERRKKPMDILRAVVIVALGRIAEPYPLPSLSRLRRDMWFMIDDEAAQEIMSVL